MDIFGCEVCTLPASGCGRGRPERIPVLLEEALPVCSGTADRSRCYWEIPWGRPNREGKHLQK